MRERVLLFVDSGQPEKIQIKNPKIISRSGRIQNMIDCTSGPEELHILHMPPDINLQQYIEIEEMVGGNEDFLEGEYFLEGKTVWHLLTFERILNNIISQLTFENISNDKLDIRIEEIERKGKSDFLEAKVWHLLELAKILDRFCYDNDIKSQVVKKIEMKIDDTNWRKVLDETMTIKGLEEVAMAALKSIITKVERHYRYRSLSQQVEEDPWVDDYGSLPVHGIKLMFRSKFKNDWNKLLVLRNWVTRNPEHKVAVLEMLSLIDLRHELVMIKTEKEALIAMVRNWLPREQFITFTKMLVEALRQQKLRQQEMETGEWEWRMGMGRRVRRGRGA